MGALLRPAAMTRRLPGWLGNLLLLLASSASVSLVVELAARVERALRGGGKERQESLAYVQHDRRLGWRLRPGARVRYERREYQVDVVVNELGLRDLPRRRQRVPGRPRVLVLGDSFVEGYTVPLPEVLTQVAEQALAPRCAAEVWNAGVGAWNTAQEYVWYVDHGHEFRPDVVLLFLYYNDILMNARDFAWGAAMPLLEERDGRLVVVNAPLRPPARLAVRPPRPRSAFASAALDWAIERLRLGAPGAYDRLAQLGLWKPLGGAAIEDAFKVYRLKPSRVGTEQGWRQTEAILRALAREVERGGARFAVVYVPSRMEVSERDWELTRRRYSLDRSWGRRVVFDRLRRVAIAGGYPLVDLTPNLRAAADRWGDVYLRFDGHWNAHGHRAAGEATARILAGLLPGCAG